MSIAPRAGATGRLLTGMACSAAGDGVLMPLLLVYLYRVRHLPLPVASLIIASSPLTSVLLMGPAGAVVDRIGASRVLRYSAAGQAVAVALLAGSQDVIGCVAAVVLKSSAEAADWPATVCLLAESARDRERVFALRFLAVNAGMGLGSLAAVAFADVRAPGSFRLLIAADALTFVVLAVCVPRRSARSSRPDAGTDGGEDPGGYRDVLANRQFVRLMVATVVLMTVGYGQLDAGIPAFVIGAARLSTRAVGLAFTANTVVVVVAELLVLRRLNGRSGPTALALVACAWAASWIVLSLALLTGIRGTAWALTAVIGSQVIFAAAETILQPVHSSLVNRLAPDERRGRYNAASGLSWYTGFFAGPVVSGLLLGSAAPVVYLTAMAAGCLLSAGLMLTVKDADAGRGG